MELEPKTSWVEHPNLRQFDNASETLLLSNNKALTSDNNERIEVTRQD